MSKKLSPDPGKGVGYIIPKDLALELDDLRWGLRMTKIEIICQALREYIDKHKGPEIAKAQSYNPLGL